MSNKTASLQSCSLLSLSIKSYCFLLLFSALFLCGFNRYGVLGGEMYLHSLVARIQQLKVKVGRLKSEDGSRKWEVWGPKTEIRSRRSQVRSRKSEVPPRLSYATVHLSRDKLQDNVMHSSLVKGCTPIVSCSPTYTSPLVPKSAKGPVTTDTRSVNISICYQMKGV